MRNLVARYIGIVGEESRSMKQLLSQTSVSIESVIASGFDLRPMAPSTKRDKRFAQEISEISVPGLVNMHNWALLPFKHLLKVYEGSDSLSPDGLTCFKKTCEYFLSLDLAECKMQELHLCIECLGLSTLISDEARMILAGDDASIDQLVMIHGRSGEFGLLP